MNNNFLPYQLKKTNDTNEALATQLAQNTSKLTDIHISVKDYGAKGDWNGTTGTDDSNAIINCATYCRTNGYTLYIPETMQCRVTQQIDLTNLAVNMQGKIIVDNTVFTSGTAVLLGAPAGNNYLENRQLIVNVNNSSKNFVNTVTGVQIMNTYRCNITIKSVKYFQTGLHFTAQSDGTNIVGNGWNKIWVIRCSDNGTNLIVDTMDAVAWTNENTFYGGDFQGASSVGILIGTTNSSWKAPNHNTFIQPDLSTCGTQIQLLSGLRNRFLSIRCEQATNIAQFEILAFHNFVEVGWDINIKFTDNAKNGTNKVTRQENVKNYYALLEQNCFKYAYMEQGTTLHVPNFSIRHYASSSVYKTRNVSGESVTLNTNYLSLSHWDSVGIRVKTSQVKNLKLTAQSHLAEDATNIRFIIVPFDVSGNRLTTSGLVQGARWVDRSNQVTTTTNYGGGFLFIPATSGYEFTYGIAEGYIWLDPTVDTVWIGVAGTDATHLANVSGFNIFVDTPVLPSVYPDYTGNIEWAGTQDVLKGTTAQRPSTPRQGQQYMDTTLNANGKPIMYNGTAWVDYTGATV